MCAHALACTYTQLVLCSWIQSAQPRMSSAAQLSTSFTEQLSTFHGFYRTNNIDRLTSIIPHQIPPLKKGSHRELTLWEAARLQSPAVLIQVRWRCKGNCTTVRCKCFKAKAECTLRCHGRDGGAQCINTGPSAALLGTCNQASQ